jgi:hypothetical protein
MLTARAVQPRRGSSGSKKGWSIIKTGSACLGILALGLAAVLAGCSSVKLANDYDPNADFARYDGFDWLDDRPGVTGEADAAGVLDASLRGEIGSELASNGMVLDSTNPGLLVIYHVGAGDEIDAGRWGYSYSDVGKGWGGSIDVRAYRAGTLVVDLIDAETMRLIWRATAEGAFRENDSAESAKERMRDAVGRMFEAFPPAR